MVYVTKDGLERFLRDVYEKGDLYDEIYDIVNTSREIDNGVFSYVADMIIEGYGEDDFE